MTKAGCLALSGVMLNYLDLCDEIGQIVGVLVMNSTWTTAHSFSCLILMWKSMYVSIFNANILP